MALGFAYSWSRLSTVFSAFAIAFFVRSFGVLGVFLLIAGSMGVVAAVISGLGPKTSRRTLEAISD